MSRKSRYIDGDVTCPYYKWSNPNRICCEGIVEGNTTNLIFGNPIHTEEYMRAYCCTIKGNRQCKLSAMLDRKYGDGNGI